jgi:polyhydroxybutyrate depolymerase
LAALFAAPATSFPQTAACLPASGDPPTRTTCRSIEVDGMTRTYRVFIPAAAVQPMPLVFVLHGGGGAGAGMEALARGGFTDRAQSEGFAVVYPDAFRRNWNDGRKDAPSAAARRNIDDVAFISALIDAISAETQIDPGRVFAAGLSNGAMMALRLGCDLADRIAGVAAVAGTLAKDHLSACAPARAISVLVMNGTGDPLVPYDGGPLMFAGRSRGTLAGTGETLAIFRNHNVCAGAPVTALLQDRDEADGVRIERTVWAGCAGGATVVLYRMQGAGHVWPGGIHARPDITGRTTGDIDATSEIWAFFERAGRSS